MAPRHTPAQSMTTSIAGSSVCSSDSTVCEAEADLLPRAEAGSGSTSDGAIRPPVTSRLGEQQAQRARRRR